MKKLPELPKLPKTRVVLRRVWYNLAMGTFIGLGLAAVSRGVQDLYFGMPDMWTFKWLQLGTLLIIVATINLLVFLAVDTQKDDNGKD